MENQHRKIKGYRELSQEEIALMNLVKDQGEALGVTINKLRELRCSNEADLSPGKLLEAAEALQYAEQNLKTGIMWLVRSVALPNSF